MVESKKGTINGKIDYHAHKIPSAVPLPHSPNTLYSNDQLLSAVVESVNSSDENMVMLRKTAAALPLANRLEIEVLGIHSGEHSFND
jgi:hypothetical protein